MTARVFATGLPRGAERDFQLMAQAWNIIHQDYVDRDALKSSVLTHAAIEGMTDSLGDSATPSFSIQKCAATPRPPCVPISPASASKSKSRSAAPSSSPPWTAPAVRAGVRAGDIILEVDGRPVAGLPFSQLDDLITGPAGASVKLGIFDPSDGRRKEFNIVRASIKVPNVTWHALPGGQVPICASPSSPTGWAVIFAPLCSKFSNKD